MKNEIIMTLLLSASCAANASVLVAPGVHLESDKTWVTGNGTGYSVNTKGSFFFGAFVTAQTSLVNGRVSQNVMLTSDHGANFHNGSRNTERYTLTYSLCTNSSCTRNEKTFSLDARTDYSTSDRLYLTTSFYQPGSYEIEAKTEVHGDANATDYGRSTAIISR